MTAELQLDDNKISVLIFGTFDVDNYGDLLFPVVAQWRINARIGAVSPTNKKSVFDLPKTISHFSFDKLSSLHPDMILIGGGNIIHFKRSMVVPYNNHRFSYAGLQFYPLLISKRSNAKLVYNAPSINIGRKVLLARIFLRYMFANANYLSFRDPVSVSAAAAMVDRVVRYVPDTAFDVSRVWPADRSIRPCDGKYFVVHVNNRYGGSITDAASALDKICSRTGYLAVFLPIGPCHGDADYAESIGHAMRHDNVVVSDYGLKKFANYIANSEAYIGSSMHGFVTALSYRVKAALVLSSSPMPKFLGVLDHAQLEAKDTVFTDWSEAAAKFIGVKRIEENCLQNIFSDLDLHWSNIRNIGAIDSNTTARNGFPSWIRWWKCVVWLDQSVDMVGSKIWSFTRNFSKKLVRRVGSSNV